MLAGCPQHEPYHVAKSKRAREAHEDKYREVLRRTNESLAAVICAVACRRLAVPLVTQVLVHTCRHC